MNIYRCIFLFRIRELWFCIKQLIMNSSVGSCSAPNLKKCQLTKSETRCIASVIIFICLVFVIGFLFSTKLPHISVQETEKNIEADHPNPDQLCQVKGSCQSDLPSRKRSPLIEENEAEEDFIIVVLGENESSTDTKTMERMKKLLMKEDAAIPVIVSVPNTVYRLQKSHESVLTLMNTKRGPITPGSSYNPNIFTSIWKRFYSKSRIKIPNNSVKSIDILNASDESHTFSVYTFKEEDLLLQRNVSFGFCRQNPYVQYLMYRKMSQKPLHESEMIYTRNNEGSQNWELSTNSLTGSNNNFQLNRSIEAIKNGKKKFENNLRAIRNAVSFLTNNDVKAKYVIILDLNKYFTPNLLSFFKQTSKIFKKDPSVYCVSADNPLRRADSRGPDTELNLVDHFVYGGGVLFPKYVLAEIMKTRIFNAAGLEIVEYFKKHGENPMEAIEEDLSWFRNRKDRSCIVPSKPRVCTRAKECTKELFYQFNMESFVHYKYYQRLFQELERMKSLKYEELPCRTDRKPSFDITKNETGFALFVKMLSLDDDLTLKHMITCFEIEYKPQIGNFKNAYKFYWNDDPVHIIGAPYSRFGPTIKNDSNLYMIEGKEDFDKSLETVMNSRLYEDKELNITTVPFDFN